MTNESKKLLSTICIWASIGFFIPALYGMAFVNPEPRWSKLALSIGIPLSLLGNFLLMKAKRRD
jgi:Mg2+ and Co2+ transporter CorA